jgi:hypothetical protein
MSWWGDWGATLVKIFSGLESFSGLKEKIWLVRTYFDVLRKVLHKSLTGTRSYSDISQRFTTKLNQYFATGIPIEHHSEFVYIRLQITATGWISEKL